MSSDATQRHEASDFLWDELQSRLAAFARVAKSETAFGEVAEALVETCHDVLAPVAAAVWLSDGPGSFRLERGGNADLPDYPLDAVARQKLLASAIHAGRAEVIPPGEERPPGSGPANPTPYPLVLAPLTVDEDGVGVVEVVQRPGADDVTTDGVVRFVALLSELASEHLRRRQVRDLRLDKTLRDRFDEFLYRLYATRTLRQASYEVANGGRFLIGCDRVSVVLGRGASARLTAISSVDRVNRRSRAVRRLERLARIVIGSEHPQWFDSGESDLPPQLEKPLSQYFDETNARRVGVLPLSVEPLTEGDRPRPPVGVLVIDDFSAEPSDTAADRAAFVARHGALALSRALDRGWLPPGGAARFWAKTGAAFAAVAALVIAAASPADFEVHLNGQLQPAERQNVFAPHDGRVASVAVRHGDTVVAGQPLLVLTSPELDLEFQKVRGEHDATVQRARAIESTLLDLGGVSTADPNLAAQLTAERQELEELFASQKARLEILKSERERLTVSSPVSGAVLSWDPDEELRERPVRRGQQLLSIGDPRGPWVAELRAPDAELGPLLAALDEQAGELKGVVRLATDRGVAHEASVARVSQRTEVDPEGHRYVRVVMDVDATGLEAPRPGATVHASVHCGRRPLVYAWFYHAIDQAHGWFSH